MIENVGVAPIYHRLPLYVKLKSQSGEHTFATDCDITKWLPGTHSETLGLELPSELSGEYTLELGIGGGDEPSVCFATDAELDGAYAIIAAVEIK